MSMLDKYISALNKLDKARPDPLVIYTDTNQVFIGELSSEGLLICESVADPSVESEERRQFEATNGVIIFFDKIMLLADWISKLIGDKK